jgi:hypothetical protein
VATKAGEDDGVSGAGRVVEVPTGSEWRRHPSGDPAIRRPRRYISHRIYLPVVLLPCSRRSQLRSIKCHSGKGALENSLSARGGELSRAIKEGHAVR